MNYPDDTPNRMKLASLLLVNSWIVIETCEKVCETQTDWARMFCHNMQALVQNVVVTKQIGILGWLGSQP